MPGSNRPAYGNEIYDMAIAPTTNAGAVPGTLVWSSANGTNQTIEVTATVPGLLVGDLVDLYLSAAMTTGLTIANVRVSAPNVMAVTWVVVGSAIVFPTVGWSMNMTRPENPSALPPNAI